MQRLLTRAHYCNALCYLMEHPVPRIYQLPGFFMASLCHRRWTQDTLVARAARDASFVHMFEKRQDILARGS